MSAIEVILDILMVISALVMIVTVLMQEGQRQGLGAIGGGAETFFGKNKAKSMEGRLQKYTKIAAVAFIVLAIAATIINAHNTPAPVSINDAIVEEAADAAEQAEAAVEEAEAAAEDKTEVAADAAADTTEKAADTVEEAAADAADTVEKAADTAATDGETTADENNTIILGDINGDGNINVSDIALAASHIKGIRALTPQQQKAADITGDGQINVSDIAAISAHIKGIKAIRS